MDIHDLIRSLKASGDSKIVMMVSDGIGGLPQEPGGPTELEKANTPNLDRLAKKGVSGSSIPIKPGITPRQRPRPPGTLWIRSAQVPDRTWCP